MNEVTPDNDTLKSSVFHRVLQRAFPEWFPYDSIRFFHPFYTAKTNAKFAEEQGYLPTFSVQKEKNRDAPYNYQSSEPNRPQKPVYLTSYSDIRAVLSTGADEIIHPAFTTPANLPNKVRQALATIKSKSSATDVDKVESLVDTKPYFIHQMRAVVEREVITMDQDKTIFQLDVTRE